MDIERIISKLKIDFPDNHIDKMHIKHMYFGNGIYCDGIFIGSKSIDEFECYTNFHKDICMINETKYSKVQKPLSYKQEVQITVSGGIGSGKTTIASVIAKTLKDYGIRDIIIKDSTEYSNINVYKNLEDKPVIINVIDQE